MDRLALFCGRSEHGSCGTIATTSRGYEITRECVYVKGMLDNRNIGNNRYNLREIKAVHPNLASVIMVAIVVHIGLAFSLVAQSMTPAEQAAHGIAFNVCPPVGWALFSLFVAGYMLAGVTVLPYRHLRHGALYGFGFAVVWTLNYFEANIAGYIQHNHVALGIRLLPWLWIFYLSLHYNLITEPPNRHQP